MIKARDKALELLEKIKIEGKPDRQRLYDVATTSLRTKVNKKFADQMADICVDAVLSIQREDGIDLHMVELMEMQHKTSTETTLVKGDFNLFFFTVKMYYNYNFPQVLFLIMVPDILICQEKLIMLLY